MYFIPHDTQNNLRIIKIGGWKNKMARTIVVWISSSFIAKVKSIQFNKNMV